MKKLNLLSKAEMKKIVGVQYPFVPRNISMSVLGMLLQMEIWQMISQILNSELYLTQLTVRVNEPAFILFSKLTSTYFSEVS